MSNVEFGKVVLDNESIRCLITEHELNYYSKPLDINTVRQWLIDLGCEIKVYRDLGNGFAYFEYIINYCKYHHIIRFIKGAKFENLVKSVSEFKKQDIINKFNNKLAKHCNYNSLGLVKKVGDDKFYRIDF